MFAGCKEVGFGVCVAGVWGSVLDFEFWVVVFGCGVRGLVWSLGCGV